METRTCFICLLSVQIVVEFARLCPCNETSWKSINIFVCQDAKVKELLGLTKEVNGEEKLLTVVYGNDLVNVSFLNFQALQVGVAKVTTILN